MGISLEAAHGVLKQFVAQETSNCPAYMCPEICTIGLLVDDPSQDGAVAAKYYELDSTVTDPTSAYYGPGYQRATLGHIVNGEINETERVMSVPTNKETHNEEVFIFGENISEVTEGSTTTSYNWATVKYFGIFNYEKPSEIDPDNHKQLVLYGKLTKDVVVEPKNVPLFRIGNFSITFADTTD